MKLKRIGAVLCVSIIFLSSMVVYGETIDSISTFIKNGKIVAYSDFSEEDDFKKIIPIDHQYDEWGLVRVFQLPQLKGSGDV